MPKWSPWVYFSIWTSLWPPVTSGVLLWLLRSKYHSLCWSRISYENACQKWSLWVNISILTTIWPLMTSGDLLWLLRSKYHILSGDIMRVCVHKIRSLRAFWPYFDLFYLKWPLCTLEVKKMIAFDSSWYHIGMYAKSCLNQSYS